MCVFEVRVLSKFTIKTLFPDPPFAQGILGVGPEGKGRSGDGGAEQWRGLGYTQGKVSGPRGLLYQGGALFLLIIQDESQQYEHFSRGNCKSN